MLYFRNNILTALVDGLWGMNKEVVLLCGGYELIPQFRRVNFYKFLIALNYADVSSPTSPA